MIEAVSESNSQIVDVDFKDIKILRELSKNARMSVIDISKKTGINTDTIIYRMKNLMKNKIILGFRTVMNENFLGLSRYKLLISLKDIDEKRYNTFLMFLNSLKSTQYVKRCIGNWDFSLTLLCKDMDDLRRIVFDIKNHLGDSLKEYKIILLFEEHKNNYFPDGIKN